MASDVTRNELELAFAHYCDVRERAIATGDWRRWAALFTEDARYVEHAYGEFHGRQAISDWIVGVMEPFPMMTFPNDWVVFDPEQALRRVPVPEPAAASHRSERRAVPVPDLDEARLRGRRSSGAARKTSTTRRRRPT